MLGNLYRYAMRNTIDTSTMPLPGPERAASRHACARDPGVASRVPPREGASGLRWEVIGRRTLACLSRSPGILPDRGTVPGRSCRTG